MMMKQSSFPECHCHTNGSCGLSLKVLKMNRGLQGHGLFLLLNQGFFINMVPKKRQKYINPMMLIHPLGGEVFFLEKKLMKSYFCLSGTLGNFRDFLLVHTHEKPIRSLQMPKYLPFNSTINCSYFNFRIVFKMCSCFSKFRLGSFTMATPRCIKHDKHMIIFLNFTQKVLSCQMFNVFSSIVTFPLWKLSLTINLQRSD